MTKFINACIYKLVYHYYSLCQLCDYCVISRYQVLYQVGVFASRSSVNLFRIKRLWILPILQVSINLQDFMPTSIDPF